jgi:hypothetical protein
MYDLNGVIDLVKLQMELISVESKDIQNAVNNSTIKNPYNGKPMDYDKEKNEISFKCSLVTSYLCKVSL